MSNRRFAGFSISEWVAIAGAGALIVVGAVCIGSAAGWHLFAWGNQQAWLRSAEAARAQHALAAPTPVWVGSAATDSPADPGADAGESPVTLEATHFDVDLLDAAFVFADPPERGARARFTIDLRVGARPAPVSVNVPEDWFVDYTIARTAPDAEVRGETTDASRQIVFDGLAPGQARLVLDVVAKGDGIQPPVAQVAVGSGELIGTAHPRTVAPRPRPGPISALRIPRLNLSSAVVPTAWEPPAFVVGELRSSANVGQGNAILVGHLTGAAGAVFAHLDELRRGDTIVATSRGLDYTFTVSGLQTRPSADSGPAQVDAYPRLTLMTCSGTWDPVARDYSDRLWVTAEPPGMASTPPSAPVPPPSVTAAVQRRTISVSTGGIGAPRDSLDRLWGPPLGETPGKLVVYRRDGLEYHVRYTPDPPRADVIQVQPAIRSGTMTQARAAHVARGLVPEDAAPRTAAPEEASETIVVERLASAALGSVFADDNREGDVIAAYTRDASSAITTVTVGSGDDISSVLATGAR